MQDPVWVMILFAFIGVTFVAFGLPLKHDKVPPNRFYGFRTRKTLSDEKIWYAVNRVTGSDMISVGIIMTGISLVLLALRDRLPPEAAMAILLTVTIFSVAWMAYHGFSALRHM